MGSMMLGIPNRTETSGLGFCPSLGKLWFRVWAEMDTQILGVESSCSSKECRNGFPPLPGLPVCTTSIYSSLDMLDNVRAWCEVLAPFSCTCAKALVNVSLKCSTCFLPQAGLKTAFSHAPLILAPINPLQVPFSIVLPIHQEIKNTKLSR